MWAFLFFISVWALLAMIGIAKEIIAMRKYRYIDRHGIAATGRLIACDKVQNAPLLQRTFIKGYAPIVRYSLNDEQLEARALGNFYAPPAQLVQDIAIKYSPDDASEMIIDHLEYKKMYLKKIAEHLIYFVAMSILSFYIFLR